MQFLDLTLPNAAENIALDEALLEHCESLDREAEVLRIWEPTAPMVVVGRSSCVEIEVDVEACRRDGVPILRRSSGGAAIVAAPGSMMYAVVLSYARRPELKPIDQAHRFVLHSITTALDGINAGVRRAGTSDMVWGNQKVSGNSMRCRRSHFLYHGTVLCGMQLDLIGHYLREPPRQPPYRAGRSHAEFVANLPVSRESVRAALAVAFDVPQPITEWPQALTRRLVAEKYGLESWNA